MILRVLWVALSLSIGWGIRGNFGHEYGAMIPGALATLAAVLLSGREDWHQRSAFFAFFGAIGWSFGGSISYMQVIAYTHCGHSGSVLYGFACLFVIGFLWASMGGAGAALPALLDRDRLTSFLVPLTTVFAAWLLQDLITAKWFPDNSEFRQNSLLYWYDTDWLAALVAIVTVLVLALIRRRIDFACSLILHMAVGWWIGFLVLVNLLGLRMTPPRGDNWAGCLGMVIGMWIFFWRNRLPGASLASIVTGFIGGFGFATADALKLIGVATGYDTNWHSLLEQTYGFINGVALAVAIFRLAKLAPKVPAEPPMPRYGNWYAAGFVLLIIPYLNLSKNPEAWVKAKAVPASLYGLSAQTWFNLAFLWLAAAYLILIVIHRRRPLPLLSGKWFAKGQLLFLVFLWLMVIGNFERALPSFAPVRLVTEGVIFLNAVLCTIGIQVSPPIMMENRLAEPIDWPALLRRTIAAGLIASALSIVADWATVRAIYGDRPAAYAGKHIRFGPNATATKAKPAPSLPHP